MMKKLSFLIPAVSCLLLATPCHAEAHSSTSPEKISLADVRSIVKVEPIQIESPVATTPRLPYQVWVTYSDGKAEYRQTKWSNSARAVEEDQANPTTHPVGHEYDIEGFIIGDNTTANGYPITAHVKVVSQAYDVPSNKPVAEAVPLNKVTILGDNRLTSNRELAIREIISWDVAQQLYNYRDTYGMPTEGYPKSDGWDSPTTKLKGHGSGHYMSSLALAFASATNPEHKRILRENMTRMVNELRACQEKTFVWNEELGRYWEARDFAPEEELREMKGSWKDFDQHKTEWAKYGYGYLNAIPAHHAALIEMYRAYNNENWVWAPYYSIHKQLAGLIDIATFVDDQQVADKALLIAKDMGLWIWNRLHYRTYVKTDGTQEERRANPGNRYEMWNMYIAGEDGGTGESLARLSEMVNDPQEKARLLEASAFFDSPAFYEPLARNIDDVRTRHANQHIPKIISALRSFRGNNEAYYYNLSQNFWEMIQGRYRYSTGGVGNGEMFRQPYTQILSMTTNGAPTLNETCCAYNLAKLTKDLNCFHPDDAKYMDYYERILYNQLVGSLHHSHYMTTYQYAVGLNASKPWGNHTPQSSCCGGTGSENHVKYQEAAYFVGGNTLWVALYIPTSLCWDAEGVVIQQDCLWPAEKSTIRLTEGKANFEMKLRVPYWATEGFEVKLNGVSIAASYQPSSYVSIPARDWTTEDVVEVIMPFSKHLDYGPDKMETATVGRNQPNLQLDPMWAATLMYGPLAMTATGVNEWEEATLTIDSYLESIIANGPSGGSTGSKGNLYTLTLGGNTFEPDYYKDENSTHYFRINLVGDMIGEFRSLLSAKLRDAAVFQPKNYTKASYKALKKAMAAGEKLVHAKEVSQGQITAQIAAIDQAINGLASVKLNKTALASILKEAEAKVAADYTWDKYDALQMAIASAKEVNEKGDLQLQVDKQILTLRKAMDDLVLASSVDKSALGAVLELAAERKKAQEAWNALAVKVPEYSPWAPHAYRRLMGQLQRAQITYQNKDKNYNQNEVNLATSSLNAAINTMRPGNLPEPEDLYPLSTLLRQAGRVIPSEVTPTIADAIAYAEMVTAYVIDGSGTHDMIQNAVEKLKDALK
ncbi:beta-L-arabinofuranosidase domain-containing protein [Parabacteroides sp. PM6-13]|uniref:beta-L-arabinofuranosidase domain-containing protein n=2 Tax=unclassified Parabacteroides TaxID=2649774 RepID=UPI0032AEC247